MDFNFPPASMAVIGEHIEDAFVILLRRVEVSVYKRAAVRVSPSVRYFRIIARPPLHSALLLSARSPLLTVFWNNARFEMISESNDKVDRPSRCWRQSAPGSRWQDLLRVGDLSLQTHSKFN
jgi:hypothetical protein